MATGTFFMLCVLIGFAIIDKWPTGETFLAQTLGVICLIVGRNTNPAFPINFQLTIHLFDPQVASIWSSHLIEMG